MIGILLTVYVGVVALIIIIAGALLLLAGIIGATAVLLAPFRYRRPEPPRGAPLWDPRSTDPFADIMRVTRDAGLRRRYTYSFEHDGPRVDPNRIQEN
jgi:hypothetical protein